MRKFFYQNGLSVVLALLFITFWAGQAVMGWHTHNEDLQHDGMPALLFGSYLQSGHFWQATGENWESEFLQMGFYVILTVFLYQRGSAESKDPDSPEKDPPDSHGKVSWIYQNSLSLAFLTLFLLSFAVHAIGGLVEENEERMANGLPSETMKEFLTSPDFWFQSFQNWQSEFLAVLSIVTLTIFLRQKGSPESKDVGAPHSETGR